MPKPIKVGDVFTSRSSGEYEVIKNTDAYNVTVKFLETGTVRTAQAGSVRAGQIKDPFYPSVQGVGFVGIGPHNYKTQKRLNWLWREMLRRAYNNKFVGSHRYKEIVVVPRWHNFQTFCDDVLKLPNHNRKGYHFDKDLRVLGNKKYGPRYCSFVPAQINVISVERDNINKSRYGTGVHKHPDCQGYYVLHNGKNIGSFATAKKARLAYGKDKVRHIREIANKYREHIHKDVYTTLMSLEPSYFID